MLLTELKTSITFHAGGGKKIDSDATLSMLCKQAMFYVMDKCVPNELLRVVDTDEDVYRNIEDGCYIVIPDTPDFAEVDGTLMIDDSLAFAVSHYVAFLVTKDPVQKALADEVINEYQANDGREYYVDMV